MTMFGNGFRLRVKYSTRCLLLFCALSMALLLGPALSGSADAATYYVSTTGSDSNDGRSAKTPFLKLSKACSLVLPGDMIYMWGNHGMKGSFGCKSGTSWDAPVTLRVLPGEKLTFSRAIPTEGAYFNTGKLGDARYISIEGEY